MADLSEPTSMNSLKNVINLSASAALALGVFTPSSWSPR